MLKQIFGGITVAFLLMGCNGGSGTKGGVDSLANHAIDSGRENKASTLGTFTIAPAVLKKYQEAFLHDTVPYDKRFVANFVGLLRQFNGKRLDTTIVTIGNLDGDSDRDTIVSRVYYEKDTIYVDSKWTKNNQVLWRDRYSDPYTSLDVNLFSDTSRNTWLCFAIGVIYGPPDIQPRSVMDSGALGMVYDQGVDELNRAGIHIDKEQYKAYLQDFKGELLAYGQPESREGLWIWYKPAGRMITYYHP